MLAIVGGSGLTSFAELEVQRREIVRTPYGEPSGPVTFGQLGGRPIAFLPRHGYGHTIPPHDINYRANVWALRQLRVEGIVAVASVGAIRPDVHPGQIVMPHQIIDYTWGRPSTYFDNPDMPVTHIDFTLPFDEGLRQRLKAAAAAVAEPLVDQAIYACTQGPRLETAAEIDRLERDGAAIVGMTLMPEAGLARELDIPYVGIAVVVNHAAGRGDSKLAISTTGIGKTLEQTISRVRSLVIALVTQEQGAKP
ncbi:MAG: S-methyl-5'-thioinosine phosphorylase [Burkholderiaceae bacterium]|jgi:5'-methylthioadenosine phosphorylase